METLPIERKKEILRTKKKLEKNLNVSLTLKGKNLVIEGKPMDEYEANLVLDAINFGFPTEKALLLKDEEMQFQIIPIKDFTRKKDLSQVRARIVGTKGKTLKTLEEISGCFIKLKDNEVGVLGPAESLQTTITTIQNLIKGTKQANVYHYLEKQNKNK
jgi:ribosomal RNA assembly protein